MTKEEQVEKVRESARETLYGYIHLIRQRPDNDYVPEIIGEIFETNPSILIKAEDQSLPDKNMNHTWYQDDFGKAGKIGYDVALVDMLKANFVKVLEVKIVR